LPNVRLRYGYQQRKLAEADEALAVLLSAKKDLPGFVQHQGLKPLEDYVRGTKKVGYIPTLVLDC